MVTMLNIYEAESWSPGDFCVFVCVFFQNLSFILKLHIVISTTAFMAGRTWEHLKHHISSSAYFSKVTSKKGKSATLSQFQWWVLSIYPFFSSSEPRGTQNRENQIRILKFFLVWEWLISPCLYVHLLSLIAFYIVLVEEIYKSESAIVLPKSYKISTFLIRITKLGCKYNIIFLIKENDFLMNHFFTMYPNGMILSILAWV